MNGDVFKAKVVYSYTPVNEDELAIQENQVVEVIRLVSFFFLALLLTE